MSVAFAAVWAALLPPRQSTASVWLWGVIAAVFCVIAMSVLFINAPSHMLGWGGAAARTARTRAAHTSRIAVPGCPMSD